MVRSRRPCGERLRYIVHGGMHPVAPNWRLHGFELDRICAGSIDEHMHVVLFHNLALQQLRLGHWPIDHNDIHCSHHYTISFSLYYSFRTLGVEWPLPYLWTGHFWQVDRHLVDSCCRLPLPWMCLGRSSQHLRLLGVHCLSLGNVHVCCVQFHQPQNVVAP